MYQLKLKSLVKLPLKQQSV